MQSGVWYAIVLWNVDALDLKNDRPCAVVTASNHHAIIVGPSFHDRTALKSRVYIPADGIPCFAAEFSVHQVIEIILLRRAFE